MVQAKIEYHKVHIVIVSFIGNKIQDDHHDVWIQEINHSISSIEVRYKMDLGRGFCYLAFRNQQTIQALLMLTPHKTLWGTSIYQKWIQSFKALITQWG
jgi:hypothetical protein